MYFCKECGNESLKWKGQCDVCQSWNTFIEQKEDKKSGKTQYEGITQELFSLEGYIGEQEKPIITQSSELNTVLGGRIIPGSIILLSGEPGIGKSTLTLQLGNWIQEPLVYISGEETLGQISSRALRLKISSPFIQILAENNIENILKTLESQKVRVAIFDSISVMYSGEINGTAGSINQIRSITEKIVEYGKKTKTCCIVIGHVTKDGSLAGPKTLEHMVDTVLYFEGDKYDNIRMLRCLKNRFGSANEIALYKMSEEGLSDIINPSLEFLSGSTDSIGLALGVTIEGKRALIIETEALTNYTKFGYPKRSSRGVPVSKLDLIIAVLGKYTPIKLESYDVYCNISRGLSIEEPGLDIAIAVSIISSKLGKTVPKNSIFIGEISLSGKIKSVMFLEKRVKECIKLGFENIYIPGGTKEKMKDQIRKDSFIFLKEILHIHDIINLL